MVVPGEDSLWRHKYLLRMHFFLYSFFEYQQKYQQRGWMHANCSEQYAECE